MGLPEQATVQLSMHPHNQAWARRENMLCTLMAWATFQEEDKDMHSLEKLLNRIEKRDPACLPGIRIKLLRTLQGPYQLHTYQHVFVTTGLSFEDAIDFEEEAARAKNGCYWRTPLAESKAKLELTPAAKAGLQMWPGNARGLLMALFQRDLQLPWRRPRADTAAVDTEKVLELLAQRDCLEDCLTLTPTVTTQTCLLSISSSGLCLPF